MALKVPSVNVGKKNSLRAKFDWDLKEYERFLNFTFPDEVRTVINYTLTKTLEDAVEKAQQLVPVDTGSLRKSIRKERRVNKQGKTTYLGIRAGGNIRHPRTGRLVNYASYVEHGTSRQRPQPFLRPALRWAYNHRLKYHVYEGMAKIPG